MLCVMFLSVSAVAEAQTRRALVIGIGEQEDEAWNKINGDKDVPYVEELLKEAGYKSVTKLVNSKATKAAIVAAFQKLARQCKPGDVVYVHYSGHGQQMKDEDNDETDALDECWIPYDAYRQPCEKDMGEKHLTDDEVNEYLSAIREQVGDEGKILVVMDACHSGDATRGGFEEVERGVLDVFGAIKSLLSPAGETGAKTAANPDAVPLQERWLSLSACQSDQMNTEMVSPAVGKLTYAIYNVIKKSPSGSNEEIFARLKKFISANTSGRPQYPVLSGETNSYRITDILR